VRESDVRVCDESSCKYGGVCKEDGDSLKCACQFQCHTNYIPVCGSNGDTYQNECFLRRAACKHQKEITVVARGPCYSDNGSGSGEGEEEGSGAEVHRKHSKCGPCKYKAECDEDAENVGSLWKFCLVARSIILILQVKLGSEEAEWLAVTQSTGVYVI